MASTKGPPAVRLAAAIGVLAAAASPILVPARRTGAATRPAPKPELLLVQGRVTQAEGQTLVLKTPDQTPGGPGRHAHFILRGKTFKLDLSSASFNWPDGSAAPRRQLSAGDRVAAVVEGGAGPAPAPPGGYPALIVEPVVTGDSIVTH